MSPPAHRKKPFSGKKKKQQLQDKNARKAEIAKNHNPSDYEIFKARSSQTVVTSFAPAMKNVTQTNSVGQAVRDTKRLVSIFERLSPHDVEAARLNSMKPLKRLPPAGLEVSAETFAEAIDFPKRPTWDYSMSKDELDSREEESFKAWMADIEAKYGQQEDGRELSWYEHNLEVWRQLWRVLEISDVVLVIMDIRHPLLHFPRALYEYITNDLGRKMVGVFNKVDLVSRFTEFAWRKYFEEQFPRLHLATFSCYTRDDTFINDTSTYALKSRLKRPRTRGYQSHGVRDILTACQDVLIEKNGVNVDWAGLIAKYDEEQEEDEDDEDDEDEDDKDGDDESDTGSMTGLEDEFSQIMTAAQDISPHRDYVTIGLVGHPNVGKSSLINSIIGRTVVSASRTPGHTKHFQTIHLTGNVRLCDSPGLVFPTLLPRALQVLSGMYPIAQVQEPYSVVQYLAERIPLEKILSLSPPNLDKDHAWSAWSICEAYAEQRGFYTAKAARPDVYRAANALLRFANDGRLLLSFKPAGFLTTKYERLQVEEADRQANQETDSSDNESIDFRPRTSQNRFGGAFDLLAEE
ncbi:hypothetical protein CLU79DRAFT_777054 [Phycomyces nitens]|nr:hypothetical protein CLU79DRAFT_777054 [Phycomyces nitens]